MRLLLRTRFDYLPGSVPSGALITATGLIGLGAKAGPAESSQVPVSCGTCKRRGFVIAANGARIRCPRCDGVTRKRTPDDPRFDLYVGLPAKQARDQKPTEPEIRQRRQTDEPDTYAWERWRQTYERMGSYRELGHALDRLRDLWPEAFDLIHRVYFRELPPRLGAAGVDLERRAVIFLAERIGVIRVPPWLLEDERVRIGRRVMDLRAQGMTQGEIARSVGLTKDAVRVLLRSCR